MVDSIETNNLPGIGEWTALWRYAVALTVPTKKLQANLEANGLPVMVIAGEPQVRRSDIERFIEERRHEAEKRIRKPKNTLALQINLRKPQWEKMQLVPLRAFATSAGCDPNEVQDELAAAGVAMRELKIGRARSVFVERIDLDRFIARSALTLKGE
ncbi:MAG: hypothetical protein EBT99_15800 [Betaproteobacteria bacterium]|nr:hypothetical protein [Betaproteobacteria bacterium]